jgi:ABC-type transport system involved in multi-copper enzyme maturation permease subunit
MSKLLLIIKREFIAKVRNKSFIVMTFLSPLLFVGIGVFVGYLSQMKSLITPAEKENLFFVLPEFSIQKNQTSCLTEVLKNIKTN